MTETATIVLDIGKSNCKLSLLDAAGQLLADERCPNAIADGGLYPHHDTTRIWAWMLAVMGRFSRLARVGAIVPVTHGATAALISADAPDGLALPVLDYEFKLPADFDASYRAQRPLFAETCSPALPAGLNLGRQLAWLEASYPAEFGRASQILMYPQYWAWRLSGVAAGEVTSLGCHTDLWNPSRRDYSSLVETMGWAAKLPPLRDAWARLGPLLPELVAATGLPADAQVICGIHDSNASLLRYLVGQPEDQARTVLSTGTWLIAAAIGGSAEVLDEHQDMLTNTNALGAPVPCMRFMGGREYASLAGPELAACSEADLARLIAQQTFALPCFAESGGPFAGREGRIVGPAPANPAERAALATLYAVLMTDHCLSALGANSPVVVEGSFTANRFFGSLLAALRPGQPVTVSDDSSGTTAGGWMLARWGQSPVPSETAAQALDLVDWPGYRRQWQALLSQS
ncbi:FGGY-family carbohydrate kinase [Roseateles oligotrophus]|uniref:L-fuculose kinase n=1 Tax=Roseateles oligotrophus TaxID=1769250 RepID=A0ABT2YAB3_9BURK|nr:FGGY family carbohydrate kinase [Roseateles oligotrophus]MCV2367236.1 L-fuculose kinase [Roseateles oligotrophus]